MRISSDATCDDTWVVKGVMPVDQHIHIHNSHKISMGLSGIDETLAFVTKLLHLINNIRFIQRLMFH